MGRCVGRSRRIELVGPIIVRDVYGWSYAKFFDESLFFVKENCAFIGCQI